MPVSCDPLGQEPFDIQCRHAPVLLVGPPSGKTPPPPTSRGGQNLAAGHIPMQRITAHVDVPNLHTIVLRYLVAKNCERWAW